MKTFRSVLMIDESGYLAPPSRHCLWAIALKCVTLVCGDIPHLEAIFHFCYYFINSFVWRKEIIGDYDVYL